MGKFLLAGFWLMVGDVLLFIQVISGRKKAIHKTISTSQNQAVKKMGAAENFVRFFFIIKR